ncbi:MAG: cation:proton antiporter [Solobacterium sp.]|nr:cation:proton antiporter [Solobacterium sp.]
MNTLFYIALAMIGGLLMTRLTRLVRLPNVTAYLIAGVLIGPYVLNLVGSETLSGFSIITECALGFIAFSIGDEFKLKNLKAIGKSALLITAFESLFAVICTMSITLLCGFQPVVCIMLGALSASTAPAATLLIVRQYKAKGPLTDMLLPVVAADDAVGLISYSICVSLAQGMIAHTAFSVYGVLIKPLLTIAASLLLGALLGVVLAISHRYFRSHTNRMSACIASVMIGVGLADWLGLSNLLLCMALGAVYVNIWNDSERILSCIDDWTYPLFLLFFVISGAQLNLTTLPKVGLLGVIYVCARFFGKFLGAYLGGTVTHQPAVVKQNLGWALMPQAGVAIGMATMALKQLPGEYSQLIQTVILSATLIYEIVGPLAAKSALARAGEIHA